MKKGLIILLLSLLASGTVYGRDGEMLEFRIKDPVAYPGTERTIKVYVPGCYTGDIPACLLVMMDGVRHDAPMVMDELMAEGAVPVTISMFIEPGKIYSPDGNVIRYNRSNEFDRTDGRLADFIENEVLPQAERLVTSDGRKVRISRNATDRAVTGDSSGGIAAFSAAWNRPDLFSRVYSIVGTFIPFRGGDQFPVLIRKTEPKPLRVYLQDNDKDTWNPLFGSWYDYNRLMYSALEFSGYDVSAHWDSGGHSGKNGGLIFKEVMRWLWAGWPAPVEPGISQNATLSDILEPGERWECIGNAPDDGRLHACSDTSVILRCGRSSYALSRRGRMEKVRKTFRQDPMTAVYPGSGQLAEALAGSSWVWNYILDGSGRKTYGQEYYYLHSAPYQITFDTKGYLYAATDTGVQICDHNGRVRAILAPPVGPVKSVAFAGNDIFVISGGRIYVRRLRRCGFTDAAGTPEPEREPQG